MLLLPLVQELLRRIPIYVLWDDHDTADDSWKDGSLDTQNPVWLGWRLQACLLPNHVVVHWRTGSALECTGAALYMPLLPPFSAHLLLGLLWVQKAWAGRESSSAKAFKDYLPVRPEKDGLFSMYRSFTFGDMATIVLPETRSAACAAGQSVPGSEGAKVELQLLLGQHLTLLILWRATSCWTWYQWKVEFHSRHPVAACSLACHLHAQSLSVCAHAGYSTEPSRWTHGSTPTSRL